MVQLSKRDQARKLRTQGKPYPEISKQLDVSKSTLNYWFKDLVLPLQARERLLERKKAALVGLRVKAATGKHKMRIENEVAADIETRKLLGPLDSRPLQAAILGALYLGEGFKMKSSTGLGNSNAEILTLYVGLLRSLFSPEEKRFRCILYLRHDQSEEVERDYWSEKLSISPAQFGKTQFDKRTLGKKTYPDYHGVCAVYCHDARIEKKISSLQRILLQVTKTGV